MEWGSPVQIVAHDRSHSGDNGRRKIGRAGPKRRERSVVIAHRYAFARVHGVDTLLSAPGLAHDCDNPLCQNHEHLVPKSTLENAHDWSVRRRHFAGPLADPRGSRLRALAIRDGLRAGRHLADLLEEGRTELDRRQLSLW